MKNLLIISALLYFVWVLIYLLRNRIRKFLFPKTKLRVANTPVLTMDDDVMGKTKTQLSQAVTNDDSLRQIEKPVEIPPTFAVTNEIMNSARIDDCELDSAFHDSPEPMDLDIECEYAEAESQEDLDCFVDDELTEHATGIEYDEMENLIQVMQQGKASPTDELNAVNTIQELSQTELFQSIVSQIDGGKQRVTNMLNKYNKDVTRIKSMDAQSRHSDFEKFEMSKFL